MWKLEFLSFREILHVIRDTSHQSLDMYNVLNDPDTLL